MSEAKILYVMGVSGSGKSTIGKLLAAELKIPFFDGDDYHPEANIKKMSEGKPLNDEDRQGWLERLNELAKENTSTGAVIVCSALKTKYRRLLESGLNNCRFVFLDGSFELIMNRLKNREDHYMPSDLLKSQFDTLEEPQNAIKVSIDQTPQAIVSDILQKL